MRSPSRYALTVQRRRALRRTSTRSVESSGSLNSAGIGRTCPAVGPQVLTPACALLSSTTGDRVLRSPTLRRLIHRRHPHLRELLVHRDAPHRPHVLPTTVHEALTALVTPYVRSRSPRGPIGRSQGRRATGTATRGFELASTMHLRRRGRGQPSCRSLVAEISGWASASHCSAASYVACTAVGQRHLGQAGGDGGVASDAAAAPRSRGRARRYAVRRR